MGERAVIALIVVAAAAAAYLLLQTWHRTRATSALSSSVGPSLHGPVVLYFRTNACAPCARQGRILEQVVRQHGDRVVIEKIDADADRETADRFGVFTVPTTLLVDAEGRVRHANYGVVEPARLTAQLQDL
jgi:thioredoxin 1